MHLLDELLDHLLGDDEVGDHAVLHRPDGGDVARGLAEHLLGLVADGLDRALGVGAAFGADRHHGRLVEHDALAANVDQRVGGAEVDRQVIGKIRAEETEHETFRNRWNGVNGESVYGVTHRAASRTQPGTVRASCRAHAVRKWHGVQPRAGQRRL